MTDYIQIEFLDAVVLNLNNEIELDGNPVTAVTGGRMLHALTGCTVLSIDFNSEHLALQFSGNHVLKMTLKSEQWRCPEAFALFIPGEPPIVLNEPPV